MGKPQIVNNLGIKTDNNPEIKRMMIYCIIVALGWLMPAMGGITEMGMKVIALFAAACYGWGVGSDIWPSLFTFFLLPITGVITFPELITGGWGTETVLLLVGIFVFLKYLEGEGVSEYIAAWMLNRKFLEGHPWRITFMIFLVAYLITSLINIIIGMLLVWGIIYSISKTIGYKPYDKFPTLMLLGVGIMGALSLSAMPWGQNSIALLAYFEKTLGHPLNIANYITFTVPLGIISIICYLLLCKFVFRLDVSRLKNMDKSFINPEYLVLTKSKKIALVALALFVISLLMPNFMVKSWALTKFLLSLGYVGKIFIIFTILSVIKVDDKRVFNFGDLASKGIMWPMIGIFIVVLPLGGCINNPATGITDTLSKAFLPILNGMSPFVFFVTITLITVFLSAVMANMPVCMMLMPIALTAANTFGFDLEQIGYLLIVASTVAWLTPSASPAGTLLYSNKEWLHPGDIVKYGLPTCIMLAIVTFLVNYYWLGLFY